MLMLSALAYLTHAYDLYKQLGIGSIRTADVLASVPHQLIAAELHALPSTVKAKLL